VHTANWDDKLDLKGKTVAVIGAGAAAIQVVPSIQPGKPLQNDGDDREWLMT
jgi:cation diffusion facilitator CzcD-associated flavoprotein CzcO